MPDSSHRAKLIVCFATVYLVWGSTYMVASIGVHELPPLLFGGIRFLCAGILLAPHHAGDGLALPAGRHRVAAHGSWSPSAAYSSPTAAPTWAMQHVASNQTAILNASAALWIALLATRGRRAHALDRRTLIGLVIGFAGAVADHLAARRSRRPIISAADADPVRGVRWSASTVYIRNAHSKLDVLTVLRRADVARRRMMPAPASSLGEGGEWHWSKPGIMAMAYLTIASSCLAYTAYLLAGEEHHARHGRHVFVRESGDRGGAGLVVPGRAVRRQSDSSAWR